MYVRYCTAVLAWYFIGVMVVRGMVHVQRHGDIKPITVGVLVVHAGLSFSLRRRRAGPDSGWRSHRPAVYVVLCPPPRVAHFFTVVVASPKQKTIPC